MVFYGDENLESIVLTNDPHLEVFRKLTQPT